eukprot:6176866-Prymnesium_polylepis.2
MARRALSYGFKRAPASGTAARSGWRKALYAPALPLLNTKTPWLPSRAALQVDGTSRALTLSRATVTNFTERGTPAATAAQDAHVPHPKADARRATVSPSASTMRADPARTMSDESRGAGCWSLTFGLSAVLRSSTCRKMSDCRNIVGLSDCCWTDCRGLCRLCRALGHSWTPSPHLPIYT